MNKTRYFKKKLSVTTDEASYTFPVVTKVTILNGGGNDVTFEIDNAIDSESFVLPAGMSVVIEMSPENIAYKTSTSTSTLYLIGVKTIKS